ncbi:MAG: MerR family transcriptional regulator [Clostridia bacterium]|nr:MerR family transcriptional regulator [Clostridia bacterium]
MKTVHQVSGLTGVSIRTLHYYDSIGLLKPTEVTSSGYRLYDDNALATLQTILLFRELQFPLKEIGEIMGKPDFDRKEALKQQTELLKLRRDRLDELISFSEKLIETGVDTMDFSAFDEKKIKEYEKEAKEKWGKTAAFAEYEKKTADRTSEETKTMGDAFMEIFVRAGQIKDTAPDSTEAQAVVKEIQSFITENYYTCTDEILKGLGQMYVFDERMKANIDKAGGEGTAEFVSKAIELY